MHYYKRNLGDYAKKAGRLSMLQHGAYTLLIDACYDREQFPTMPDAIDWTWASSTAEVEAVEFVLRKFFTLEGERYVQKRIQEEIAEYRAKSELNTRIAQERETKRKEKGTERAQVVNEPPPNQEPLTINQEPVIEEPNGSLSASAQQTQDDEPDDGVPPCPFDKLIDSYQQALPSFPQVRRSLFAKGSNGKAMRARWRWVMTAKHERGDRKGERLAATTDDGIAWFGRYFDYVADSDFLTGRSGRFQGCDLGWLVGATNFEKVLSGKYHSEQKEVAHA